MNFDIFLDKKSPDEMINRPHRIPPYTYYSNGYYIIALITDDFGIIQFDTNKKFLNALNSLPAIGESSYKPLPQYAVPEVQICKNCEGTGYVTGCPECEGQGSVKFKNEYNTYQPECLTCNGATFFPSKKDNEYSECCEKCDGAGKYNYWGYDIDDQLLNIGGYLFNKNLLEKLKLLPLFAIQSSDPDKKLLQFSFFGGKGLLVGLLSLKD